MIHVCFSIYDKLGHYSKFTGTAMLSLFENINSQVTIHILHDNTLTQYNRDKFWELTNRYGQIVKFYNVEELCADRIAKIRECFPEIDKSHFSIAMFYRFFIPYVLPAKIEKVIYLDSDIIVNLDINELWQIEIADNPLAVVLEIDQGTSPKEASLMCYDGVVKEENYFNSGVLVMNLEILHSEEDNILEGMKFVGEHPKYRFLDQEILNYCFESRTFKLPVKFNRMIKNDRINGNFSTGKGIYHYAGNRFALGFDIDDSYNRLWWSYFIKTPWFNVDTMYEILKGAQDSMLPLSVPSDKERVFVVEEEHADQIEKNFFVRYEEEVIIVDLENEDWLEQLIDLMENGKGTKIFFIGIPKIFSTLNKFGFWENKHFFDVSEFYSPTWANRTNRYNLILSL